MSKRNSDRDGFFSSNQGYGLSDPSKEGLEAGIKVQTKEELEADIKKQSMEINFCKKTLPVLKKVRVFRDNKRIQVLENKLQAAVEKCDALEKQLGALSPKAEEPVVRAAPAEGGVQCVSGKRKQGVSASNIVDDVIRGLESMDAAISDGLDTVFEVVGSIARPPRISYFKSYGTFPATVDSEAAQADGSPDTLVCFQALQSKLSMFAEVEGDSADSTDSYSSDEEVEAESFSGFSA